jgi:serine/threonine protein kinase
MRRLSGHRNVLRLDDVLELIQESKLTFFLVLELASGGELFDRITADEGCDEDVARGYLTQLLEGVSYCHSRGVCHRDLKPENLLLTHDGDVLKIADFGLSTFMLHDNGNTPSSIGGSSSASIASSLAGATSGFKNGDPLRRLVSIVGSCHYIAPEVLNKEGYDGTKADAWSIGVIMYALLAGSLPFGKELLTCPRFLTFSKHLRENNQKNERRFYCGDFESVATLRAGLDWFLPEKLSNDAVSLIIGLLNPDPSSRYTIKRALSDGWFRRRFDANENILLDVDDDSRIMMDVVEGNTTDEGDERDHHGAVDDEKDDEDEDMFEIEVDEKKSFVPTPSKQIMKNNRIAQLRGGEEEDMARSAPARNEKLTFTSPPLAPKESFSPPSKDIAPDVTMIRISGDQEPNSNEPSRRMSNQRLRSGSVKDPLKPRARSSSPPPSRKHTETLLVGGRTAEAPMFHEAMKRTTIFTTCVPASQVLERVAKTVTELGGLSTRIDWDAFQLEIVQDNVGLQLCLVQIFLSRERPGPVYIVEFVRGPEFEIFAFKAFYQQVTHHLNLANIVRGDHTHTLRY